MPTDVPPIDPNDPQQVVASAWQDQALWSEVGNRLGTSIDRWRVIAAAASVAGVSLMVLVGSLAMSGKAQAVLATLSVLLLAVVPYLRQKLLSPEQVLAWTRARNVAEQLKEAIYRHMMGALPPVLMADGSPPPDPTGPGNLVRRCRAIKQVVGDLALQASVTVVAPRPRKTSMVLADYLADRLEGQISYFRKAGARHGDRALWLQRAELVLGLLTVLVGALAGKLLPSDMTAEVTQKAVQAPLLQPLLVLVGACTAAVSAHMAGTRSLELAGKYFATHELLRSLRDEWRVSPDRDDPARVLRLVDEVERALATEHGGWMSDWQQALQQTRTQMPAPAPAAEPGPGAAPAVATAAAAVVTAGLVAGQTPEPPPEPQAESTDEPPAEPPAEPPPEPPPAAGPDAPADAPPETPVDAPPAPAAPRRALD